MPADSTRSRILTAARTVIVRDGTAGARMREIADRAGVSTAALHYHFGSKRELADRVLETVLVRLVERFLNAWSPGETLAANVRRAVRACHNEFTEDGRVAGYVLAELHLNPDRFERVRKRLPASVPYELDELVRHLKAHSAVKLHSRPEEFLLDLIGLCAVPFLARPLLPVLLGPDPGVYESVLEGRGVAIHDFLLACAETAETSPWPVPNTELGGREPCDAAQ